MESWTIDKHALGRQVLLYTKQCIDMALEYDNNNSSGNSSRNGNKSSNSDDINDDDDDKSRDSNSKTSKQRKRRSLLIHLQYKDIVSDPTFVCKEIFKQLNMAFTPELELKIKLHVEESNLKRNILASSSRTSSNHQTIHATEGGGGGESDRSGSLPSSPVSKDRLHDYNLKEYGLCKDEVDALFQDYIEKFRL
jgi:hypothetical protein